MLRSYGRFRALSRWLAAVLLVTGWLVPLAFPHTDADDLLCVPFDTAAGSTQARLDQAGKVTHPGHCVICHANRSFRTSLDDSGPAGVLMASGQAVVVPLDSPHRTATLTRLPARAPPA